MQLKHGTLLQGGKYRIERMLGQGGFGITYLAEQPMLERKVCVKEFFFKDYCEREEDTSHVTLSTKSNKELVERFRKKFLKEARVISKLHHDHIVQIHDIFEENSTAYYVMDFVEGESLGDMIKRVGFINENQAISYIKEVASALAYIHAKSINHLDIKPGNIMLRREDNRILLIDFGVSKQYDEGTFEGTTTTPVGISHGYSPAEQYRKNGVQSFSPQSDVYALAATLYKLLTGITPPEAIEIQDEGLPLAPLHEKHIASITIDAITKAMRTKSQRTQSINLFVENLINEEETTIIDKDFTSVKTTVLKKSFSLFNTKKHIIPVISIIIILIALFGYNHFFKKCDACGKMVVNCDYKGEHPKVVVDSISQETKLGLSEQDINKQKIPSITEPSEPSGYENGHGYLDLGLSVKWATCNVGTNNPFDYGDYFTWGEIKPKSAYYWSNCFDCLDKEGKKWNIYKLGGKTQILPTSGHDAARENWGGKWRMPTEEESKELCDKCEWTWTSKNGHNGFIVTGPNGNNIFLPAAGYRYGKGFEVKNLEGHYWASTLSSLSDGGTAIGFEEYIHYSTCFNRDIGASVRPVTE